MNVSRVFSRALLIRGPMVVLLGALCARIGAAPAGQQPPPAGATSGGQQLPGGARAGGPGGRGNATASLFASTCAPCHGIDLAGGRAASLFTGRFLASNDDETLIAKITNGVPNTAMLPFKDTLDEQQIWQIVAYIRTQGANLKDKPVFVPDPNNQIIKSERQTFRIEVVVPGHRNPRGWRGIPPACCGSPSTAQTVATKSNIIEKGKNYGWGVISMGLQNGITERSHEGMEQPIVYYTPAIAPSGIGFYTGSKYPGWKNNLFVAALAGQQLRRLEISGRKVTHQEAVFEQFGRVRAVTTGPDGLLYVLLQNPTGSGTGLGLAASTPGMVIRLVPVRQN